MTNDKESDYDFVHSVRFGKGQSFSNKASTRLSQGVIPALPMIGLPASLANALVSLFRKNELIGFPEIAVTLASLIGLWNLLPKFAAGCLAAIPDDKGYDLACATTDDRPNPAFVPFFVNK